MKAEELRNKSAEELNALLDENKKELYSLKNELKESKKIEKVHLLREMKKNIARILTVMTEKEMQKA